MNARIVLADDQALARAGMAQILTELGHDVVGVAADGEQAVEMARRLRPDVCLLDIRMPRMDGIEATRLLAGPEVDDPVPVVILTTFDLDEYVSAALANGARGFLLKDAGPALIGEAVHAAVSGEALIAPAVAVRYLEHFTTGHTTRRATAEVEAAGLSGREAEVVRAVAAGRTNHEVARELHMSLGTVKSHLAAVQQKLGVRNRVEIAAWAWRTGVVTDGDRPNG